MVCHTIHAIHAKWYHDCVSHFFVCGQHHPDSQWIAASLAMACSSLRWIAAPVTGKHCELGFTGDDGVPLVAVGGSARCLLQHSQQAGQLEDHAGPDLCLSEHLRHDTKIKLCVEAMCSSVINALAEGALGCEQKRSWAFSLRAPALAGAGCPEPCRGSVPPAAAPTRGPLYKTASAAELALGWPSTWKQPTIIIVTLHTNGLSARDLPSKQSYYT